MTELNKNKLSQKKNCMDRKHLQNIGKCKLVILSNSLIRNKKMNKLMKSIRKI